MEKIASKSTKALYQILVTSAVLIAVGTYLLITYSHTSDSSLIAGYLMIGFAILILIFNFNSIFSPTILIEKTEDSLIVHSLLKKQYLVPINQIIDVTYFLTLTRYLRPLNSSYYTYGTLTIKTEKRNIKIRNIEDLKDVYEAIKGYVA